MEGLGVLQNLAISTPPLAPAAEVTWLLRRAFGPIDGPAPKPEPTAVVGLARDLGLAGCLCRRLPMPQLQTELGLAGARELVFQHLQVRAANRILAATLETVIEVAGRESIQLVLLKHAALWRSGVVEEGQRDARDIDVLVSATDADVLWRKLREGGFLPCNVAGGDFHLTPLVSASGACVELHHHLWGVELDTDEPATVTSLVSAGVTRNTSGAHHVHIPDRNFLIAHALVHGFAQHLTSPADYAPLRVFSDLVSLQSSRASALEIHRYVKREFDVESVEAALQVGEALAAGSSLSELEPGASQLLSHALAASTDRRYGLALRAHRLLELGRRGELLQATKRFFGAPAATEGAVPYQQTTLGGRAREAWELALGLIACAQLRRRRARPATSSTAAGNSSRPARPNA